MNCPACEATNDASASACFACGGALDPALAGLSGGGLFASRYEIQAPLGRGGMGMVYAARDRELGETVAIKVLRPDLARHADRVIERFRSEIRLARRVRHRNVCPVYGDGEDRGLLYIVMELVEGETLAQRVRLHGAIPPEEAWDVVMQVGVGLRAIHEAGVVHRDLKTANIMCDVRGAVRVMDFGIAKQLEEGEARPAPTASGALVGTPEYMSPEHIRGEAVDARSDLYSLGVVAYEVFTGTLPFRGPGPASTILKQLQDPPPVEVPAIPRALRPVLRRALAKDRDQRFQTIDEMLEALRGAREGVWTEPPTSEPSVSGLSTFSGETLTVDAAPAGGGPWARWPFVATGLAAMAALTVSLAVRSSRSQGGSPPAAPAASGTTREAAPAASSMPTPSPATSVRPLPPPPAASLSASPPRTEPAGGGAAPDAPSPSPTVDQTRIYKEDDVDVAPRRLSGKGAAYPDWGPDLKPRQRVSITASFVVTVNGDVTDIRVERGRGPLEAVLLAMSRWKYAPAMKGGVPVNVRIRYRQTFVGG